MSQLQRRQKFYAEIIGKEIDRKRGIVRHAVTSNRLDRDSEVVIPSGGDFSDYQKNPIVLYGHQRLGLPIGKNLSLEVVEEGDNELLMAETQYHLKARGPGGEFARSVWDMEVEGGMPMWSLGFLGTKIGDPVVDGQEGPTFERWKMIEYSKVPIGSNIDAVTKADLPDPIRRMMMVTDANPEDMGTEQIVKALSHQLLTELPEISRAKHFVAPLEGWPSSREKDSSGDSLPPDADERETYVHFKAAGMSHDQIKDLLRTSLVDVETAAEWIWVRDVFEDVVVYEVGLKDEPSENFERDYTLEGNDVELGEERRRVRRVVTWEVIDDGEKAAMLRLREKEGRVLSAANRKRIKGAIEAMDSARSGLQELLEKTDDKELDVELAVLKKLEAEIEAERSAATD